MDANVILVSVPRAERVPPLILRLITTGRRLRSAVRLRRIVRWHLWMSHENEEFLDVDLYAAAQSGLRRRRIIQVGAAQRQQASFQGQLGGAPPLVCKVSEGFGLLVELVDGLRPPDQPEIVGVEDASAPGGWMSRSRWAQSVAGGLLGTGVMMVGGIEIAD